MQGVTRHADVGAGGAARRLHDAPPRGHRRRQGTTRTLNREAIYDYQYAAAARDYGAVVWMDAPRRRQSATPSTPTASPSSTGLPSPPPSPLTDCPPTFGNLDIYSGSFLDPTP